jgi:hypothetical protein
MSPTGRRIEPDISLLLIVFHFQDEPESDESASYLHYYYGEKRPVGNGWPDF